jgi:hypothetical protein
VITEMLGAPRVLSVIDSVGYRIELIDRSGR